jgi:hypothetical protein
LIFRFLFFLFFLFFCFFEDEEVGEKRLLSKFADDMDVVEDAIRRARAGRAHNEAPKIETPKLTTPRAVDPASVSSGAAFGPEEFAPRARSVENLAGHLRNEVAAGSRRIPYAPGPITPMSRFRNRLSMIEHFGRPFGVAAGVSAVLGTLGYALKKVHDMKINRMSQALGKSIKKENTPTLMKARQRNALIGSGVGAAVGSLPAIITRQVPFGTAGMGALLGLMAAASYNKNLTSKYIRLKDAYDKKKRST